MNLKLLVLLAFFLFASSTAKPIPVYDKNHKMNGLSKFLIIAVLLAVMLSCCDAGKIVGIIYRARAQMRREGQEQERERELMVFVISENHGDEGEGDQEQQHLQQQ